MLIVGVYTTIFALALFLLLRRYNLLRVNQSTELAGLDMTDHMLVSSGKVVVTTAAVDSLWCVCLPG